jgi:hypothetical protein
MKFFCLHPVHIVIQLRPPITTAISRPMGTSHGLNVFQTHAHAIFMDSRLCPCILHRCESMYTCKPHTNTHPHPPTPPPHTHTLCVFVHHRGRDRVTERDRDRDREIQITSVVF